MIRRSRALVPGLLFGWAALVFVLGVAYGGRGHWVGTRVLAWPHAAGSEPWYSAQWIEQRGAVAAPLAASTWRCGAQRVTSDREGWVWLRGPLDRCESDEHGEVQLEVTPREPHAAALEASRPLTAAGRETRLFVDGESLVIGVPSLAWLPDIDTNGLVLAESSDAVSARVLARCTQGSALQLTAHFHVAALRVERGPAESRQSELYALPVARGAPELHLETDAALTVQLRDALGRPGGSLARWSAAGLEEVWLLGNAPLSLPPNDTSSLLVARTRNAPEAPASARRLETGDVCSRAARLAEPGVVERAPELVHDDRPRLEHLAARQRWRGRLLAMAGLISGALALLAWIASQRGAAGWSYPLALLGVGCTLFSILAGLLFL